MKNYFKKFSIMFVMLLAIISIGVIENGSIANAATVGQQLTSPESGWQRIDNSNNKILYNAFTQRTTGISDCYKGTDAWTKSSNNSVNFEFYGTKLRILGYEYINASNNVKITIDGNSETFNCEAYSGSTPKAQVLQYQISGLILGNHNVTITNLISGGKCYYFDCLDIDEAGYLLSPSIDINKSSIDLTVGDEQQLNVTTTPSGIGVSWSSSDTSVATVDSNGNVTAVGAGTAIITATTADGSNLSSSCTINVTKKTISLDKSSIDLTAGDEQQLTVTTTPASASVTWTSSDTSIATVDSNGKVTGVSSGTATITATINDGSNTSTSCIINVTKKEISLNKSSIDLTAGETQSLTVTTTPASASVTWTSSDTSVATVDSNGNVTAVASGTATITATTADGSNLGSSCTINVSNKVETINIDKSSVDFVIGDEQQLTVTTTPSGIGVLWSSSDTSVATVDSSGKVTGVGVGTVTITATTTNGQIATCTINVKVTTGGTTTNTSSGDTTDSGTTDTTNTNTGDAALLIELVDGNIKSYDVTADEITKFIKWYNNRDNDDSQSPYYQFTKGTYKDYVIYDKIDWFEVR